MSSLGEKASKVYENLLLDAEEFLCLDQDLLKERIYKAGYDMQGLWLEKPPTTPQEHEEYYIKCGESYIYDLSQWHYYEPARRLYTEEIVSFSHSLGLKTVLDFGAGIGTDSLCCALEGAEVIAADFPSDSTEFASWKASKYRAPVEFTTPKEVVGTFDLVVAIDVLEHIADWRETLAALIKMTRKVLAVSAPFNDGNDLLRPMHYPVPQSPTVEELLWGNGFRPKGSLVWVKE